MAYVLDKEQKWPLDQGREVYHLKMTGKVGRGAQLQWRNLENRPEVPHQLKSLKIHQEVRLRKRSQRNLLEVQLQKGNQGVVHLGTEREVLKNANLAVRAVAQAGENEETAEAVPETDAGGQEVSAQELMLATGYIWLILVGSPVHFFSVSSQMHMCR